MRPSLASTLGGPSSPFGALALSLRTHSLDYSHAHADAMGPPVIPSCALLHVLLPRAKRGPASTERRDLPAADSVGASSTTSAISPVPWRVGCGPPSFFPGINPGTSTTLSSVNSRNQRKEERKRLRWDLRGHRLAAPFGARLLLYGDRRRATKRLVSSVGGGEHRGHRNFSPSP